MKKGPKLFLTILILIFLSAIHFAQNNPVKTKKDAEKRGMEIVFVVDVSFSMQWDIKDIKDSPGCVSNFIEEVCQMLNKSGNNFHLITFSDYATYHQDIKVFWKFRDKIKVENDEALKKSKRRTYPKNGLWEVFDLIEENFIDKVGVVILLGDGEDDRNLDEHTFKNDMRMSIKALKNIGFSVFPVFVNTGKTFMRRDNMVKIRELADTCAILYEIGKENYELDAIAGNLKDDIINNARFNSPKLHSEFIKVENDLKREKEEKERLKQEVEVAKQQSDEKIVDLKGYLMSERTKSLVLKFLNNYLALENEEYKTTNKWLLGFLLGIIVIILAVATYFGIQSHKKRNSHRTTPPPDLSTGITKKSPVNFTSTEKIEISPPDLLWGKLVDLDTQREYDLTGNKNGHKLDCLPGVKFFVDKRDRKKVICVQQEKGSIEFRDANNEICENNCGYIGEDTRFFIIKNFRDVKNEEKKFQYHFLNKLDESLKKPVLDKDIPGNIDMNELNKIKKNFMGRSDILQDIKDNFDKEEGRTHCLISGMGNSGKTSLMRYMHNVFFPNDNDLSSKYISKLFEFNEDDYEDKTFSDFEKEIEEELNTEDKRTRLILIDEYDKIFHKYGDEFGEFLKKFRKENVDTGSLNFFIFSGQRGQKLIDPQYKKYIPEHTTPFVLKGLDELKSITNKTDKSNTVKLIDNLLNDIGFPKDYLPDTVKNRIIKFSSGFPYIVMKILHQLLVKWLLDSQLHPLREDCVDEVVRNIKIEDDIDATKRACKVDAEFNKDTDKISSVSIEHIIQVLRKEVLVEERINKEDFRDEMSRITAAGTDLIEIRKKSFDKKIKQLVDMGLMIEDKKDLIPIPYMFFY